MQFNQQNDQNILERPLIIDILILVVIISIIYLINIGIIPKPTEILNHLKSWYTLYGYWTVFGSALLEGLVGLSLYFPGSTAIVLGVVLAKQSNLQVPLVIITAISGFFISYNINYLIGKYGIKYINKIANINTDINKIKNQLAKSDKRVLFFSFLHPNLSALTTTAAGIIQMPRLSFILTTLCGLIVWDTFWGIVAYFSGDYFLKILESWLIIPVSIIWGGIAYLFIIRNKQKT